MAVMLQFAVFLSMFLFSLRKKQWSALWTLLCVCVSPVIMVVLVNIFGSSDAISNGFFALLMVPLSILMGGCGILLGRIFKSNK